MNGAVTVEPVMNGVLAHALGIPHACRATWKRSTGCTRPSSPILSLPRGCKRLLIERRGADVLTALDGYL